MAHNIQTKIFFHASINIQKVCLLIFILYNIVRHLQNILKVKLKYWDHIIDVTVKTSTSVDFMCIACWCSSAFLMNPGSRCPTYHSYVFYSLVMIFGTFVKDSYIAIGLLCMFSIAIFSTYIFYTCNYISRNVIWLLILNYLIFVVNSTIKVFNLFPIHICPTPRPAGNTCKWVRALPEIPGLAVLRHHCYIAILCNWDTHG